MIVTTGYKYVLHISNYVIVVPMRLFCVFLQNNWSYGVSYPHK